jgi:hypothetical protein
MKINGPNRDFKNFRKRKSNLLGEKLTNQLAKKGKLLRHNKRG